MFDISLTEMLLVVVIGLLVIGPDDLPSILRAIGKTVRKIKKSAHEFMHEFEKSAEIDDIKSAGQDIKDSAKDNIEMIVDLEGNLRRTYDIKDFMGGDSKVKNPADE